MLTESTKRHVDLWPPRALVVLSSLGEAALSDLSCGSSPQGWGEPAKLGPICFVRRPPAGIFFLSARRSPRYSMILSGCKAQSIHSAARRTVGRAAQCLQDCGRPAEFFRAEMSGRQRGHSARSFRGLVPWSIMNVEPVRLLGSFASGRASPSHVMSARLCMKRLISLHQPSWICSPLTEICLNVFGSGHG